MQLLLDFHTPFTFCHDAMNWKYNLVHFKQQFVLQRARRTYSCVQPGGEASQWMWSDSSFYEKMDPKQDTKNEGKLPLKVDPEALIVSFIQWHWVRALSVRSYFSLAQESCQESGRLWKGFLCPTLPSPAWGWAHQEAANRNWNSSLLWQDLSSCGTPTEITAIPICSRTELKPRSKESNSHHIILCHGDLKSSIKKHTLLVHLVLSFCSVVKENSLWISILLLTRVRFWSSNTNKKLQHLCFKCCSSASYSQCSGI